MADLHNTPSSQDTILFYSRIPEFSWLSNFSEHSFQLDGLEWPSVEHYFQAQKFPTDEAYAEQIRLADTPLTAKKLGKNRSHPHRDDWEEVKEIFMRDAVMAKFSQNEELEKLLLSTGSKRLVEHSTDSYCAPGKNRLGELLMEVRAILSQKADLTEVDDAFTMGVVDESSAPAPVYYKPKSHTTALDRAVKRKHKNRDRRNVWKDETGQSVFQIDNDDPQAAVLFKDADITVPMTALPESAKHVMRKHQYVLKYSDRYAEEDFEHDDDEEVDAEAAEYVRASPSKRVAIASYLPSSKATHAQKSPSFSTARDCISGARALIAFLHSVTPADHDYLAYRQQCTEILPLLFGFVDQPQSDSVMAELLETIDALNTCSAV